MDEKMFIRENAAIWKKTEADIYSFKKRKGLKRLSKEEIDAFILSYNKLANDLSYARTNFGPCETTTYLNKLFSQAHAIIYSTRKAKMKDFFMFFVTGFPRLLRENIKFFIVSTLVFMLPAVFAFGYSTVNPDNALAFVPAEYLNLRQEGDMGSLDPVMESTMIGTNNIRVCFTSFAYGVTLGVGTIYILSQNGIMLGALGGIKAYEGQGAFFWSLIVPHGVPELFAIFVCGAAGLMLGYSLINPGKYSRRDAFIKNVKKAILLVLGCVPILIIAAIIEGFFTPLDIAYGAKFAFAAVMFALICVYILLPGRKNKAITASPIF